MLIYFGNFIYCSVENEEEKKKKKANLLSIVSVPCSLMKELQISYDHIVNLTVQISVFFSPRIWGAFCRKYFNDLREGLLGCILCLLCVSLDLLWVWALELFKDFIIFPWRKTKLSAFLYYRLQDIWALQPISLLKVWKK